jgi:hypothetical protein
LRTAPALNTGFVVDPSDPGIGSVTSTPSALLT